MSRFSTFALLAATAGMMATATVADAQRVRANGPNGAVTATQGPNGGGAVRSRGVRQNADGSVQRASGGAVRTPNGGRAQRASTSTVNPDGSANRRSAASGSGVRGSAATQSDVTRNADGTYSGGRTTTATRNSTGTTYNGSTQIDPATGQPVRNASCTDAAGNSIPCPTPR
jgi:hypothetical protein